MKNLNNLIILAAVTIFWINSANAQNSSANVALNKPATASTSYGSEAPGRAFDGDLSTNWSANQHYGWIQVDLQNKVTVDSMKLYVNQFYAGNTVHEIKVTADMTNWTLVQTLSDYTSNNQVLSVKFSPALTDVRGVMINTPTSNSWIAWYEIEVWAKNDSGISTGVTDIAKNLRIYPNPASDYVTIEGITNTKIEIFNVHGQAVKNISISETGTGIDIADLTNGAYSMKITTNEGVFVMKLLKQ